MVRRTVERETAQQAQQDLERARTDLERWEHQRDQRKLELDEAERMQGERVLAGVSPDGQVNRASTKDVLTTEAANVTQLRAEVEAADRAVEVARKNIDKAQRNVWLAEAEELITEAKRLRTRAKKRQERTNRYLASLREWEGVDYLPSHLVTEAGRSSNVVRADDEGSLRFVTIPKTQDMLNKAAQLERQAHALQERAANTPEARAAKAEEQRKARQEWLDWERRESERKLAVEGKGAFSDYHDLDSITAESRFLRPGPDDPGEEHAAYRRAVEHRAKLRQAQAGAS